MSLTQRELLCEWFMCPTCLFPLRLGFFSRLPFKVNGHRHCYSQHRLSPLLVLSHRSFFVTSFSPSPAFWLQNCGQFYALVTFLCVCVLRSFLFFFALSLSLSLCQSHWIRTIIVRVHTHAWMDYGNQIGTSRPLPNTPPPPHTFKDRLSMPICTYKIASSQVKYQIRVLLTDYLGKFFTHLGSTVSTLPRWVVWFNFNRMNTLVIFK